MTEPSDDDLQVRLRAADPASTLPPAPPEGVARLLEETMSHDVLPESRELGTRHRSPLTWLVAAAVVVVAGVGLFAVLGDEDDPATPQAVETTVTELHAPDTSAYAAKCMVPNAEVLAGQSVAFEGTVTDIEGDLVTLDPSHWYAGNPTDVVTVTAPGETLEMLLSAVEFEDGARYLVAADDRGDVMVCGFSAPWSEDLRAVYDEAFGS